MSRTDNKATTAVRDAKATVPPAVQDDICQHFCQRRKWLLRDLFLALTAPTSLSLQKCCAIMQWSWLKLARNTISFSLD